MKTVSAVPCAEASCHRRTRHATGRCHDHRASSGRSASSGSSIPAPTPSRSSSIPGAVRKTNTDGSWTDSYFDYDGELHREDGPARRTYYPDGSLVVEEFYERGKWHRENGPAFVRYRLDGTVISEEWLRRGKHHRIDGPAIVEPTFGSRLGYESWKVNGVHLDGPEGVAEMISTWGESRLRREFAATRYAPLLDDENVDPRRIALALSERITSLEGVREFAAGAPAEWVRSFEDGAR